MSGEWVPGMVEPDPSDVPMFDVRADALPKVTRRETSKVKNLVKCDDCMVLLAIAKLFRRKQGAGDLLLCEIHAQYRREEDGLKKFERKSL